MKLNYFLLLILSVCLTNNVFTQKKIVLDGVVLDYESKGELVYAHVYCKNLSIGTFTNSEGKFVLVVPESAKNEVFTVSCIGYYESEISVSSFNEDTIFLFPKTNVLEEVEIISEYKPKEILKKVYKKRKINYPYDDQYCCNAYYREYFKRNDTTVQMLELSGKIREKGMKYQAFEYSELAIDSIFKLYRHDDQYIFSSLMFFGLFNQDGIKNSYNGTLLVDRVFFINNQKLISITFIPKKSDTITYEAYESSVIYNEELTNELDSSEIKVIKVVSTSQYNRLYRFVINLNDYALVEYHYSFNLLGEPEKFDLSINKLYYNKRDAFVQYDKVDGKYYPVRLQESREIIFTKSSDFTDIDYRLNSFTEYFLFDFRRECHDSGFTNNYLFYLEFYDTQSSKIVTDGIIPQFEDSIKIDFEENIR
jgi:hypothetical protein